MAHKRRFRDKRHRDPGMKRDLEDCNAVIDEWARVFAEVTSEPVLNSEPIRSASAITPRAPNYDDVEDSE